MTEELQTAPDTYFERKRDMLIAGRDGNGIHLVRNHDVPGTARAFA
jgi:hypothetical protein